MSIVKQTTRNIHNIMLLLTRKHDTSQLARKEVSMQGNMIVLKDAARMLNTDIQTLRKAVKAGLLTAYRIGNKDQTTEKDLQNYIEKMKVRANDMESLTRILKQN